MATEVVESAAKKARQHTVYKNKAGKRVPGTTTITGVMDKPALKYWANQIGLMRIKIREYVDELAQAGTLAHQMIQWELEGVPYDTDLLKQYSADTISLAETSVIKFLYWRDEVGFEAIWTEKQMVSEIHQYGGMVDAYGVLTKKSDEKVIADIKTAKAVYDDMYTQVAGGYGLLCQENGYPYSRVLIVRVGRNAAEGTDAEAKECPCPKLHEKRFLICRDLYRLNYEITKASK